MSILKMIRANELKVKLDVTDLTLQNLIINLCLEGTVQTI